MTYVTRQLGNFLLALSFLTRLPVPSLAAYEPERLARAAVYFPLVGALIGAVVGLVLIAATQVLPPLVAACLAIAAGLLLTGALHEDGLADSFDGLAGSSREKRLEIMRDSRLGTYGSLALMTVLGLRWSVLMSFEPAAALIALMISHSVSRALLPAILVSDRYARQSGLGQAVAGRVSKGEALLAIGIAFTQAMTAGVLPGLVALAAAIGVAALALLVVLRQFGGYTGDSLGAIQQLSEVSALLCLFAVWR